MMKVKISAWVIFALVIVPLLAVAGEQQKIKVSGKVTDINNAPVAAANVYLYKYGYARSVSIVGQTATKDDGTFVFSEVAKTEREQLNVFVTKERLAVGGRMTYEGERSEDMHIYLQPPVTVSGEVVDKNGKPVSKATVTCHLQVIDPDERYCYISSDQVNRRLLAATNEEGMFMIENLPKNSNLNLTIEAEGFATLHVYNKGDNRFEIKAGTKDLLYTLLPEGRIEGEVVDAESGKKAAGIPLFCAEKEDRYATQRTQTDDDGNFHFKGLKAGVYTVLVDFSEKRLDYTVLAKENVQVAEGECVKGRKMEMIKGGYVTGRVTDAKTGTPVKDATLGFLGPMCPGRNYPGPYTVTNEDGTYKFVLPPGENTIMCYGGKGYQYAGDVGQRKVSIVAGQTTPDINFSLSPLPRLKGIVVDEEGNAAAGASVGVLYGSYEGIKKTDKDGKFDLVVSFYGDEPSKYICSWDENGKKSGGVEVAKGYNEQGPVKIVLFPCAAIKGKVADKEGKCPSGVRVSAIFRHGNMGFSMPSTSSSMTRINIDSGGSFEIIGLPGNNKYEVYITAGGYGQEVRRDIFINYAQVYDVGNVILNPANSFIAGRVVDEEGNPVVGVDVHASGEGQKYSRVKSEPDGKFRIDELVDGKVYISASRWGPGPSDQISGHMRDVQTGRDDVEIVVYSQGPKKPKDMVGKPAPPLGAEKCLGVQPEEIKIGDGTIVVMVSLSIYSPSTKRLLPDINNLVQRYKDKRVLFIGLHDSSAEPSEVQKMIDSGAIGFPVIFSKPKLSGLFGLKIFSDYNISVIPQVIVIDSKGIIKFSGADLADAAISIDSLLKQPEERSSAGLQ
jgi:protocatechuate 3,4-dioxygenase beta subunit